jgi:hypothetical protein
MCVHGHALTLRILPTQSFCAALHQELKEYYRLLSVLHSQVRTSSVSYSFKFQELENQDCREDLLLHTYTRLITSIVQDLFIVP